MYIVLSVAIAALPWLIAMPLGFRTTYPYVLLIWGACDWMASLVIRREMRAAATA